jgi:membrane associated rhomboid family serine protease/cytochrome c-type biogenesis protein CcmH/NrfG
LIQEGERLANCVSCGRELPSFSTGELKNLCPDCQHSITTSSGGPALPAPSQRVQVVRRRPPVTTALIALNVLVYVAMVLRGVSPLTPTGAQLLPWGANWGPLSLGHQPWRILASNYVHVGVLHIALNMWCLWNMGWLAELIFDAWTYALLYTVCGIAGGLASLAWHPLSVGAGASGAIFGIAGALIAALYLGHLPIPKEALRGTLKSLVMFAIYNLAFGAVAGIIDNSAHIGGLVAGLALGAVLSKHLRTPPEDRAAWRRGVFAVAAVALVAGLLLVQRLNGYVVPLEQGNEAYQQGKLDDAARSLMQAAARKPNDRQTLYLLSSTYMRQQQFSRAIPILQHEVQLDPSNEDVQLDLGVAHFQLGEFDEAIPYLQKAVQLNPKDDDAQKSLQEALFQKKMKANSSK